MLQARIQYSGLPKHFQHSRTTMEKMKNWKSGEKKFLEKTGKIKCDFYSIILLMYHICAVLYSSHTVARSINRTYLTSVAVFVKLVKL